MIVLEPSEEELRRNLKSFGHKLNRSLEEFLGRKYRLTKGVDKAQLYRVIEMAQDLRKLDYDTIDLNDVKPKMNKFFEEVKKVNTIRKLEQHPLDFVVNLSQLYLNPPRQGSTLRETRFMIHREAAFSIARKVQDAGKVKEVLDLYQNVPEKYLKEFGNHAQWLIKEIGLLEKRYARLNARAIDKYWILYFDMCVHLEKIIRLMIGVNKIMNGQKTSYEELENKGQTLGSMVNELKALPHFMDLLEPIEPIIKNAKSHGRRIMNESEQKVIFNDRKGKSIELTFQEFVDKSRETAAAMIVSAHLDSAIIMPDLERFRDFLKS